MTKNTRTITSKINSNHWKLNTIMKRRDKEQIKGLNSKNIGIKPPVNPEI